MASLEQTETVTTTAPAATTPAKPGTQPSSLLSSSVPLAPSGSTTQTVLPDWYTNYAQDILSRQAAVAATPYPTYQGPRVADFTADQQAGFDMTRTAATAGQGAVSDALSATQGTLGRSSLGAAQPFLTQAGGLSGINAATPNLQTGAELLQQSTQGGGLQAAQPFLTNASNTAVSNIGTYMNPYQQQVVDRIGDMGARTLREKLLPEISDRFIGAGGFGGTRQAEITGRALRDTMEGISAEQSAALQAGYGQAATLSQSDLARQAQLASTAGGLGSEQQRALQSAGTGIANIGTSLGNLTAEQQRALASLGETTGRLYGADTTQTMAAASQMGALGQQQQQMGLAGAGALQNVGAQQQALGQRNLDTAYADFLKQQAYPQEQITGMMGALQGVAAAVPKATLESSFAPYNPNVATPAKTTGLQDAATAAGSLGTIFEQLQKWGIIKS
jgi:hypothetical protein